MSVNPYINFNGNCREAVEYYAEIFETESPRIMTFGSMSGEMGESIPETATELVMYTRLTLGGSMVMFSDIFPGTPYHVGNNIILTYMEESQEKIKTVFEKMKKKATVNIELQETPWSKCYGSLTDQFGITWQFNSEEGHR